MFPPQTGLVSALLQYTKDNASPEIFRLWAAIQGIGAAGERRVWTEVGDSHLYPNLYVWLVGPPGVGKTMAINPITRFLRKSKACFIAPNDMSKAGLLDALTGCGKETVIDEKLIDYFYMTVHIAELSNFMPKYDGPLAGVLTDLWDCPDINEESKRHGQGKTIPFPGLSMLVGTATGNLGAMVPNDAWNTGFMARVIMVYSADDVVPLDMFAKPPENTALTTEIESTLKRVGKLKGRMEWSPQARAPMQALRENQREGGPTHIRLTNYTTRRWFHVAKLSMISALSNERMEVEESDFHTAMSWLLPTEGLMPEIFRTMISHEDGAILEELRQQVVSRYRATNKTPVDVQDLYVFLSKTVAAYRAPALLDMAVNADYIRRVAGTSGSSAQYVPAPRSTSC